MNQQEAIFSIPGLLKQLGVDQAVLCPGSRSAPLAISFLRSKKIDCKVIIDERSAGYIAMGLALKSQKPVCLICTSGTAAVNFYPAITEAYYQQVPLIVLTGDRPPELIDQEDGQAIHQEGLYANHILRQDTFPIDIPNEGEFEKSIKLIERSYHFANGSPKGPVHVNFPIREPFYPSPDYHINREMSIKPFEVSIKNISDDHLKVLKNKFEDKKRILVVLGQLNPDPELSDLLESLNCAVFADITSNYKGKNGIYTQDAMLIDRSDMMSPDLIISFGKSIISKQVKLWLRESENVEHWYVGPEARKADTYGKLTEIIDLDEYQFIKEFKDSIESLDYLKYWKKKDNICINHTGTFMMNAPFGEMKAVESILKSVPEDAILHLANSMPVRYANYLQYNLECNNAIYSNRGTSGIDGSLSTAVGIAINSASTNIFLTGDLSFFYDRNGLWNVRPKNLRIIILNNGGGGIFRMINGPKEQPELEQYFDSPHDLNAKNTASDYGLEYICINSQKELDENITTFFKPAQAGKIMEIFSDKEANQEIFTKFKREMKSKLWN